MALNSAFASPVRELSETFKEKYNSLHKTKKATFFTDLQIREKKSIRKERRPP